MFFQPLISNSLIKGSNLRSIMKVLGLSVGFLKMLWRLSFSLSLVKNSWSYFDYFDFDSERVSGRFKKFKMR